MHHRDPFDRMLVAQALETKTPLVSIDAVFDRYGVERIWCETGNEGIRDQNRFHLSRIGNTGG
jgi:hypothetical protein